MDRFKKDGKEARGYLPGIEKKGYPAEFCNHLEAKLNSIEEEIARASSLYASELIKGSDMDTKDDVLTSDAKIETTIGDLDEQHQRFKHTIYNDIKKLGGEKTS